MMNRIIALAACAAAFAAPCGTAFAQDTTASQFTPDGPWALDYGESYCRLGRSFTNGEETLAFALERSQPAPIANGIFVSKAVRPFRGTDTVGVTMLPGGSPASLPIFTAPAEDGGRYMDVRSLLFHPEPPMLVPTGEAPPPYDRDAELAFAAEVEGIRLDEGLNQPLVIQTGNMQAPIQALQGCVDDLIQFWGFDADAHRNLANPAWPAEPVANWLEPGTLPWRLLGQLAAGRNTVRLDIGVDGKVTECTAITDVLNEELTETICSALSENGDFVPARTTSGEAIPSFWLSDIVFLAGPPRR